MCECSNANSLSRCVLLIYFFIRQDPEKILFDVKYGILSVTAVSQSVETIIVQQFAAWYGISEASFKHCGRQKRPTYCKESTFISCTDADQSLMESLSLSVIRVESLFFLFFLPVGYPLEGEVWCPLLPYTSQKTGIRQVSCGRQSGTVTVPLKRAYGGPKLPVTETIADPNICWWNFTQECCFLSISSYDVVVLRALWLI